MHGFGMQTILYELEM